MARLIDADKAIDYLKEHKSGRMALNCLLAIDKEAIIKFLNEKCPTIELEDLRPHRKWIMSSHGPYCSNCGIEPEGTPSPYCPHCGAKMDGKEVTESADEKTTSFITNRFLKVN